MTTSEIIEEIIQQDKTDEVLKILLDMVIEQRDKYKHRYYEHRASLQAIHKINQIKKRDEAIEALSEVK